MVIKSLPQIAAISLGFLLSGCATDNFTPVLAVAPQSALQPFASDDTGVPTWEASQVDMQPRQRRHVSPKAPVELLKRGGEAEAVVDFIVDETGKPRCVFAARATNVAFGQAAAEALAKWQFSPGRKDGKAVRTHMSMPMNFSVNEN